MWLHSALCVVVVSLAPVQDVPAPQEPAQERDAGEEAQPTRGELSLETLSALQKSRDAKQAALKAVRDALAAATSEDERPALQEQARTLQAELDKIKHDHESIVTGIDVRAFDSIPAEGFDLQNELQELVRPIVEELKAATEAPRQIERLRAQVSYFEERERLARRALENASFLLTKLDSSDSLNLGAGLEETRVAWESRVQDISAQKAVARFQLEKRLSERSSIIESSKSALATFFRTRGLNLVLGIATFFVVLFGLRLLYRPLARRLTRKGGQEHPFYARLIDVLYMLFVGSAAVVAALLVLYASGDWVLLGLTLLFLFGLAWASKTAVPMFLEQIRLLLNFGTVRERERVMLDGIPYRVSKLSFYALLSNADLAGGVRRLPIRDLIQMRSRICSKDEIWFPCRRGDWVLLSDGTRGVVRHQSPDTVQIEMLGGTLATYPSTQFIELSPKNLSAGFRLQVNFGIDYAHQAICLTDVPAILSKQVRAGIEAQFGAENLSELKVEFLEAGASSLDYAVIADVFGDAAPAYDALRRAIQRLCVETCNTEGWVIPFTQVTLHQGTAPVST